MPTFILPTNITSHIKMYIQFNTNINKTIIICNLSISDNFPYLFSWLSTAISANCLCFDTQSDILVELPYTVKYFPPYEACKTVNWTSTYQSC